MSSILWTIQIVLWGSYMFYSLYIYEECRRSKVVKCTVANVLDCFQPLLYRKCCSACMITMCLGDTVHVTQALMDGIMHDGDKCDVHYVDTQDGVKVYTNASVQLIHRKTLIVTIGLGVFMVVEILHRLGWIS